MNKRELQRFRKLLTDQRDLIMGNAKRALHKCAPYAGLPAGKYDEWRILEVTG